MGSSEKVEPINPIDYEEDFYGPLDVEESSADYDAEEENRKEDSK